MAEKFATTKYCPKCADNGSLEYCTGQKWGDSDFLITCEACGWNLISLSDFRGANKEAA